MEYKLILSGPVNKRTVENAVIDWVRKHPQGVMATSGSRGLPSQSMPVPQNRQQQAPAHSPALAPQRTQTRVYGSPAPAGLEQALSSHIRLRRISEMGKGQVHTFIYNERELLIVRQGNLHHQWVQLKHSWETTQGLQAVQAVQPNPANLSEWDRLKLAMASGIRQLPGQVVETVQKIIDSLLTWQGMLLIVAVTAIFVLGGEIALILMGAVAVYDLLMNVLPLLVEFYHKAVAAKDQAEIDAAGKLFAQAILRGGLDVIDILFAGGAVRRLPVLGGGRITARAVWVYLEERIGLLVARLQKGAGKLQQVIEELDQVVKSKDRNAILKRQRKAFVEEVRANALRRIRESSASQRGPCYSGVLDQRTGNIFYGENFNMKTIAGRQAYNDFYNNAHPIIKSRIDARNAAIANGSATPSMRAGTPGAHAEVVALDKALKARETQLGRRAAESDLAEMDIHNISMSNNRPGETMHRCDNCSDITRGTNTIGHN